MSLPLRPPLRSDAALSVGNPPRMELRQEQADDGYEGPGDEVSLLLAVWTLSDGWAAAHPGDTELATRLLGLTAWPEQGWKREGVWYGA